MMMGLLVLAAGLLVAAAIVAAWQVWRTPAGDLELCQAAAERRRKSIEGSTTQGAKTAA